MSTWVKDDQRTWIQKLCAGVLKRGPLPNHVGFILDGNRRFAKGNQMKSIEGHSKGFEKLAETLRWCLDFGISEVTVYVFSIENFKRPKEEVEGLMALAKEKFEKLLEEKDKINQEGVCIQIIGDWSLVPSELKKLMAQAMILTKNNTRAKLNVAFAYTARNEMARGINSLITGVNNGELQVEDLSDGLLENAFQIHPPKPLDLLVRTSGETRLSDFLLWQSSETVLCFTDVLWPAFTYWHLLGAIFSYQSNYLTLSKINIEEDNEENQESERRKQEFSSKLRGDQWNSLILESESIKVS